MRSPGESLKQQREAQGKSVEEMSEATGIRLDFLSALEQDAFDALPGRGFGKLYIRAYAEVLGFDPKSLILAYDRAHKASLAAPVPLSVPPAPRPVEAALARWRQERMAERQEEESPEEQAQEEEAEEIAAEIEESKGLEEPPAPEPMVAATAEQHDEEPREIEEPPEPEEAPVEEDPPVPEPVVEDALRPPVVSRSGWRWASVAAVLVLLVTLGLAWWKEPKQTLATVKEIQPQVPIPAPPPPPPVKSAPTPRPAPTRREIVPSEPSHLAVAESAVGLRQGSGRVQGESDRYTVGQRVSFVTRVTGGKAGERIRHVWMRDGKVEQSIRLRLGAASYRTYSTKTLGRPGAWAVEARDDAGRVLARAEFACAP